MFKLALVCSYFLKDYYLFFYQMNLGLSKSIGFQIAEHVNMGIWLVSATMDKTTSSVEILVSHAV
jgi:hypothetical protein